MNIKLGKDVGLTDMIDDVGGKGEGISIFYHEVVGLSIVLDEA
jgi:hypothetical protein